LNLYDFQRITEGTDKGAYFHELFVQGRPILSTMMKRNKIKGVNKLQQAQVESEVAAANNYAQAQTTTATAEPVASLEEDGKMPAVPAAAKEDGIEGVEAKQGDDEEEDLSNGGEV
jgi:nucleoid-associated protein YgaU